MTRTYECLCGEEHPITYDSDGYGLVNCPVRGTVLADKEGDE